MKNVEREETPETSPVRREGGTKKKGEVRDRERERKRSDERVERKRKLLLSELSYEQKLLIYMRNTVGMVFPSCYDKQIIRFYAVAANRFAASL